VRDKRITQIALLKKCTGGVVLEEQEVIPLRSNFADLYRNFIHRYSDILTNIID